MILNMSERERERERASSNWNKYSILNRTESREFYTYTHMGS